MQDGQRNLMDVFLRSIVTDEGFAREVAEMAHRCEEDGNNAVAACLMNISRNHRIRGMEYRAKLAVLADGPVEQ